jgi:hypothetical protein
MPLPVMFAICTDGLQISIPILIASTTEAVATMKLKLFISFQLYQTFAVFFYCKSFWSIAKCVRKCIRMRIPLFFVCHGLGETKGNDFNALFLICNKLQFVKRQ